MHTTAQTRCAAKAHPWLVALALLLPWAAFAQVPVPEGSTLHVYSTLLQIPVLILSNKHQSLPTVPAAKFLVTLGKDAPFRPRLVRLEGDDPITLAILLDGASESLLPQAVDGLAAMVGEQLLPHDRVVVYAMDGCKLLRLNTLGAMHPNAMRIHVHEAAVMTPYNAYAPNARPCPQPVGLWDATDYLERTLAGEPGRRVVLAVTNGQNHAGTLSAETARRDANHYGVTVFAVAERYKVPPIGPVFPQTAAGWRVSSLLGELTEGSGGMIVESTRNDATHAFVRFVELLRGRYIVEFQRPAHTVAGVSIIDVRCGLPKAFIRPAGTSMPIADPVARDPNVQHGPATEPIEATAPTGPPQPVAETLVPAVDTPPPTAAPVPAAAAAARVSTVQHGSALDITDEAVPIAAPLPAGTAVK